MTDLHAAAQHARQMLERALGIVDQIATGAWDADLSESQQRDLADSLLELAERARRVRSDAGAAKSGTSGADQWRGPLPFNRKERFFTGSVFPGLVGETGFFHLQRCLDLFGVPAQAETGEHAKIQFLTEYGFTESVVLQADRDRWGTGLGRETPDIVMAGPNWLLAIEAKVFHNPTAAALEAQMTAQRPLVDHWRRTLDIPAENVVHALLLPERLAARERDGLISSTVVTWEDLLDAYRHVAPPYWVSVLSDALENHAVLESVGAAFKANSDRAVSGAAIVADAMSEAPTIASVGRRGGRYGKGFLADVETGQWAAQIYEVRSEPLDARNWMTVAEFLEAIGKRV
jgi:hypothetical protein